MDKISVEAFDLLMRSLERQYAVDPRCFIIEDKKITFNRDPKRMLDWTSVEPAGYGDAYYVHLKPLSLVKCDKPGFFAFKDRAVYNNAEKIYRSLMVHGVVNEVEAAIVAAVPAAKDIIAERALVGDHGNETSDSDPQGS